MTLPGSSSCTGSTRRPSCAASTRSVCSAISGLHAAVWMAVIRLSRPNSVANQGMPAA